MKEVERLKLIKEFEECGSTKIKVFYVRASYILYKDLVDGVNNLIKDINKKIENNEEVSFNEKFEVLEKVDKYLMEFNQSNIRNRGGYRMEAEYRLSINTIIINIRYFSPSGNMYYIDDENFRVLTLYKEENNMDVLREYMSFYSEENNGRVRYVLNEYNELEAYFNGVDIEKMMDIMNLLADSTLDEKLNNKVNIDNIVYNVSNHHQMSNPSLPKTYKIISFKILSDTIKLNLKDMKTYEIESIESALSRCLEYLNKVAMCLREKTSYYDEDKQERIYYTPEVDEIVKSMQKIAEYERTLYDNRHSNFNIDTEDPFIIHLLYEGLLSVRASAVQEINTMKNQLFLNGRIELKEKFDRNERIFDFCTKVIEILEPKYKGLNKSELIRGL